MSNEQYIVVYISSSTETFKRQKIPVALASILINSRNFNRTNKVRGLLCYHEGQYLQVIQGARPVVQELMNRIKVDDRHKDVRVLAETTTERVFLEDSPMRLMSADQTSFQLSDVLNRFLGTDFTTKTNVGTILENLSGFAENKSFLGHEIKLIMWPRFDIMTPTRELLELCALISRDSIPYEHLRGQNPYRTDLELNQTLGKLNSMSLIEMHQTQHPVVQSAGNFFGKVRKFISNFG